MNWQRITTLFGLLALLAVPVAVAAQGGYPDDDQMGGGGGAAGSGSSGSGIQVGGAPPMNIGADSDASMPREEGDVTIVDFSFQPATIIVSPGDSVTWVNEDPEPHTATANSGAFDSGTLGTGGSHTETFETGGVYPYHCEFHPNMHGTVVVIGM